MARHRLRTADLLVAVLVLLAFAAIAGAFIMGFGPAAGGTSDDVGSSPTTTPGETSSASSGGGGATADSTPTTVTPPFGFTIVRIEECGRTCRDVTSAVTNQQETTAFNVTVHSRLYVGNGTDGDVAWEGTEPVGTLAPDESYTTTRRVELSYSDAFGVTQNDGWLTVQTTVQTAEQTVTFTDRWQVA